MEVTAVTLAGSAAADHAYEHLLLDRLDETGDLDVVHHRFGSSGPVRDALTGLRGSADDWLGATVPDLLLVDVRAYGRLATAGVERLPGETPVVGLLSADPTGRDGPLVGRVHRGLLRRALGRLDGVLCASRTAASAVTGLPERQLVAPVGREREPLLTTEDIDARAHQPGPLRLVYAGPLTDGCGLQAAVTGLSGVDADWHLTVVGDRSADSDYVDRLEARIDEAGVRDAVRFEGRVSGDPLADLFRFSHLFLAPALRPGCGYRHVQAMGFGLPVVARQGRSASDLVVDRENGRLVPPEDTRALREAVAELAADRTTLTRHGWAARGRFEAQPTWQTTVDRTVEFFEQARGRRPTDPEAPQRSP